MKREISPTVERTMTLNVLEVALLVEHYENGIFIPGKAEMLDKAKIDLLDPDFMFWSIAVCLIFDHRKNVVIRNVIQGGIHKLKSDDA